MRHTLCFILLLWLLSISNILMHCIQASYRNMQVSTSTIPYHWFPPNLLKDFSKTPQYQTWQKFLYQVVGCYIRTATVKPICTVLMKFHVNDVFIRQNVTSCSVVEMYCLLGQHLAFIFRGIVLLLCTVCNHCPVFLIYSLFYFEYNTTYQWISKESAIPCW